MSIDISSPFEQDVISDVARSEPLVGEWLSRLVRFDTSNPPGCERDAQDWLGIEFGKLGLDIDQWDVLPGRPNMVATWKGRGGGRSLILNGHVDVAEVRQPEIWKDPAFSGVLREGMVHGRGSSDMKCGIAGFYFALKALRNAGYEPSGNVVVECVMGEERGEPGVGACLDRGYRADFAIVGEDSQFRVFPNVGSITGYVEIRAPESLHVNRRIYYLHPGGQLNGANVLEKIALKVLPALNDLERHWANQRTHPLFPPGQEMIAPFLITGGGNPFITPDVCRLYFHVFYLPGRSKAEVFQEIEAQIGRAASLDLWLRDHPPKVVWQPPEFPAESVPADVDPASPALRLLDSCHSAVLKTPLPVGGLGFSSDAGWLYQAGIPAVSYGPGDPAMAHSVDERVRLADVVQYAQIVALFAARWTA
jgi:acetylornithine deacetylase